MGAEMCIRDSLKIEGETIELEGSAAAQYEEWRNILRAIYIEETGLTTDLQ